MFPGEVLGPSRVSSSEPRGLLVRRLLPPGKQTELLQIRCDLCVWRIANHIDQHREDYSPIMAADVSPGSRKSLA